jgi:hypothetical protein
MKKASLKTLGLLIIIGMITLVLFVTADNAPLEFREPILVPHEEGIVQVRNVGPIYFGFEKEDGIKTFFNRNLYGKDAHKNDYRLVADTTKVMCHATMKVNDKELLERLSQTSVYKQYGPIVDIRDENGNLVDTGLGTCISGSEYVPENTLQCSYHIESMKQLVQERARGHHFTCEMTFSDPEDRSIVLAHEKTELPLVVADVNFHITTINSPSEDFGNIIDQFEYMVDHTGIRAQKTLDDHDNDESLMKAIFYDNIDMVKEDQFLYIPFTSVDWDPGENPLKEGFCLPTIQHAIDVRDTLGIPEDAIDRKEGDVIVGISNELMRYREACPFIEIGNEFLTRLLNLDEGLGAIAPPGEHYILMRPEAPSIQLDSITIKNNQIYTSIQPTLVKNLAHELGHALEYYDESGNIIGSACDEYGYTRWLIADRMMRNGIRGPTHPNGCFNPWPPCCTEEGGFTCSPIDKNGKALCLGMPIGYEDWEAEDFAASFNLGPDKQFSMMGRGDTYAKHYRSPLAIE